MNVRRGNWRGAAAWLATLTESIADQNEATTAQPSTNERDRALEALGVGIATLRADGVVDSITQSGAALLGTSGDALVGTMFDASLDEAAVRAFRRAFNAPAHDAQPFVIERPVVEDNPRTSLRVAISPNQESSENRRTLVLTEIKNGNGGAGRGSAVLKRSPAPAMSCEPPSMRLSGLLKSCSPMWRLSVPRPIASI